MTPSQPHPTCSLNQLMLPWVSFDKEMPYLCQSKKNTYTILHNSKPMMGGGGWASWSVEILVLASPTGYMLTSFGFLYQFEVYSIYSSKAIRKSPEVLMNLNRWLFLKLNRFISN